MRLAILLALPVALGTARADELLDRLVVPEPPEPYQCGATMTVVSEEGGETEREVWRRERGAADMTLVDGSPEAFEREAARREAASEPEAGEPDGEEAEEEERVSFGFTPYEVASRTDGLPYERVGEEDGLAVYRAAPLPKDSFAPSGRDMSKRSSATLHVDGSGEAPVVRRHAFALDREFRVPMIARVRTLDQATTYEEVGGRMRPAGLVIRFDADVRGNEQKGVTTITLSDWDCPAS